MGLAPKIPALLLALAAGFASPRAADAPLDHFDGIGPGQHDSGRFRDNRDRAAQLHDQLASRLGFLSGRFEGGKNPRALELADKIRSLLAQAKIEIGSGRSELAMPILLQAEVLLIELGRHASDPAPLDPLTGPGGILDLFKDQRPAVNQAALADAWALQRRLQEHLYRLRDRPGAADDEISRGLVSRVQDLLDKSKENLVSGKADAGRELALKAEALMAELHHAVAGGPGLPSDASRRRLEERIQRGLEQLRRDPGPGDADRLAGAASLLEQARASLAAGKAGAAEQSLKQAEKLLGAPGALAGGKLGNAAFDRLQGKLEKARSLVRASGSEKAARILEKGLEHFGKAERFRSEGQAVRAEAEMDIALKLAAKAVDIARAAGR